MGILRLFISKPKLSQDKSQWTCDGPCVFPSDYSYELGDEVFDNEIELSKDIYPEVTFKNSPKELVIK